MSHYTDQVVRFCNKCNTFCDSVRDDLRMLTACKCGDKEQSFEGIITTKAQREAVPKRREDPIKAAVKSDGGSSSYYQLRLLVKSNKIKDLEGHDEVKVVELETGDIIRALVDNDFDLGNIIKACRRIHQAKKGTGKAGTDVEYDCKKIEYFLKEWYNAYAMEQL